MKSCKLSCTLLGALFGVALAVAPAGLGAQPAAAGAAPVPVAEFRRAIDRAALAADAVAVVQRRAEETGVAIAAFEEERNVHQANRCIYPPNQPAVCAAYDANSARLTAVRDALILRVAENQRLFEAAVTAFEASVGPFAAAAAQPEREGWRQRVAACVGLADAAAAAACLRRERGYDPPVRVVIETAILSPDDQAGMKSRHTLLVDFAERRVGDTFETGVTDIGFGPISSVRDNFRVSNVRFLGDRVVLTATGETASGVRILPNINYTFELTVDRDGVVRVAGCHDGYPAYTVIANGVTVYSFRHLPGNRRALWGNCDVQVGQLPPQG